MGVKVREQRGRLYLDIYKNGARKWESLHITLTDDKRRNKELLRLAEICRSKREAQLLTGEWGIKDDGRAEKIALPAYIESYSKHYSDTTLAKSLASHIRLYANGGTIQMSHVSRKWVEDFQRHLTACRKRGGGRLSQTSVSSYMRILCAALRKAAADGTISRDPTAGATLVKPLEAELVFLSADELRGLAAVTPDGEYEKTVRRAFLFSCFTGLRISDIETLTWAMIERDPPQIIKRQKKTQNQVFVPLGKSAMGLIVDGGGHRPEEPVFDFMGRRRASSYGVLKKWAEDAGIRKRVSWHTARRTFATLALGRGADPITVAGLLGHTGLGQVMRYAKATDDMKRKAVESLPELETQST